MAVRPTLGDKNGVDNGVVGGMKGETYPEDDRLDKRGESSERDNAWDLRLKKITPYTNTQKYEAVLQFATRNVPVMVPVYHFTVSK